jgi:hypothetical protein
MTQHKSQFVNRCRRNLRKRQLPLQAHILLHVAGAFQKSRKHPASRQWAAILGVDAEDQHPAARHEGTDHLADRALELRSSGVHGAFQAQPIRGNLR